MIEERITELEALPKGELDTMARTLDVKGRSSMDAPALAQAIADAERSIAEREDAERRAAAGELEPGTPEEVGRPDLIQVAEERAAARKPHRVIGADPTEQED